MCESRVIIKLLSVKKDGYRGLEEIVIILNVKLQKKFVTPSFLSLPGREQCIVRGIGASFTQAVYKKRRGGVHIFSCTMTENTEKKPIKWVPLEANPEVMYFLFE